VKILLLKDGLDLMNDKFALTTTTVCINLCLQIFNYMAPDDGRIEGWRDGMRMLYGRKML
jgi:hypothetical protein